MQFMNYQAAPVVSVITVETYQLRTNTGRKIRKATRVKFTCGRVVAFTEKLSNREAIKQATAIKAKG